jgi:hypothetical protein
MKTILVVIVTILFGVVQAQAQQDSLRDNRAPRLSAEDGYMQFYSGEGMTYLDIWRYPSLACEVKLPLKMTTYSGFNGYRMGYWFAYKSDQIIFIVNDRYEKSIQKRDTVYIPTDDELVYEITYDYYRHSKPVLKKDGEIVMRLRPKYNYQKFISLLDNGAKFGYLENKRGEKIAERLEYGEYPHPRRKNMVVIKDGTEIIFYNIKRKNFDKFYDLVVNSFVLIEREKPYRKYSSDEH